MAMVVVCCLSAAAGLCLPPLTFSLTLSHAPQAADLAANIMSHVVRWPRQTALAPAQVCTTAHPLLSIDTSLITAKQAGKGFADLPFTLTATRGEGWAGGAHAEHAVGQRRVFDGLTSQRMRLCVLCAVWSPHTRTL